MAASVFPVRVAACAVGRRYGSVTQSANEAWPKMDALPPTLRCNRGEEQIVILTPDQYGGFLFSRCALAASIHHARSSAKRGNACDSALPPSPVGLASSLSVCAIGPTAIV